VKRTVIADLRFLKKDRLFRMIINNKKTKPFVTNAVNIYRTTNKNNLKLNEIYVTLSIESSYKLVTTIIKNTIIWKSI